MVYKAYGLDFLQAKILPGGRLAVAISFGQEVFVGILLLAELTIRPSARSRWHRWDQSPFPGSVDISTICERWVLISRKDYDEKTWTQHVPAENVIPGPRLALPAPELDNDPDQQGEQA